MGDSEGLVFGPKVWIALNLWRSFDDCDGADFLGWKLLLSSAPITKAVSEALPACVEALPPRWIATPTKIFDGVGVHRVVDAIVLIVWPVGVEPRGMGKKDCGASCVEDHRVHEQVVGELNVAQPSGEMTPEEAHDQNAGQFSKARERCHRSSFPKTHGDRSRCTDASRRDTPARHPPHGVHGGKKLAKNKTATLGVG